MKKITQIFILFIIIIILSSLTFINIFKESFQIELSEEEQNIMNNITKYNTQIDTTKNLLPNFGQNIDIIKNNKNKIENRINTSSSSLTNINSTNLTLKNQLDKIQTLLGTGNFHTIEKLGITQNVKDTPYLLNANLLSIIDNTTTATSPTPTPTSSFEPTTTPTSSFEPTTTPTSSFEPTTTPTSSFEPTPTATSSFELLNESTSSFEPSNESTSSFEPSNESISPFMNVAKKSKESFINLLNNMQARKPVEHFTEPVNWRDEWNSKLESISRTQSIPLSNMEPKINDNETSFYIVQNRNLEKNLENTSANIIKMQMQNMTEILRDKWIENNRK
jgi:hypothetical protein